MELNTPEKKHLFIIPLSLAFLLLLGAGIYSLIKSKGNIFSSYSVNKYPDTVNWCDTSVNEGILIVDCKALLINIGTDNCFDVQIITKDKELKDLNVCESGDTLAYTNDVLGYKKLMPVDIVFTYTKEGILNDYSFTSVSFDKVDDTYIQNIVNEDIANLVTIDPSTASIRNSVDFCPRPEALPEYVTETNKTAYTEYFSKNILTKEAYENTRDPLEESTSEELRSGYYFFSCESQGNLGYNVICSTLPSLSPELLMSLSFADPVSPKWGKKLETDDLTMLEQISYLYDNNGYLLPSYIPYIQKDSDAISSSTIRLNILHSFIMKLGSRGNLSEEVYCSMYSLLGQIEDSSGVIMTYKEKIKSIIAGNISKLHSTMCFGVVDNDSGIDFQGIYLKNRFSTHAIDFITFEKCSNLQEYIK